MPFARLFSSGYENTRPLRISIGSVSFHRPSVLSFLLLFSFFVPLPSFPQRNVTPGSPRSDDRQLGRSIASPVLPLIVIPLSDLSMPEKTHGCSSRNHSAIRLSLVLFRRPIPQCRM